MAPNCSGQDGAFGPAFAELLRADPVGAEGSAVRIVEDLAGIHAAAAAVTVCE
jgi:hypothetical protein